LLAIFGPRQPDNRNNGPGDDGHIWQKL